MKLSEVLSIRPGITALIGSGGKTTAMYTLARELQRLGTVVCCTTTHILPPAHMWTLHAPSESELTAALASQGCVCLGTPTTGGKLTAPALPMERVAALADYVLVEADGARGLPLKAHLPHEPAVPAGAGAVILLAGASGFSQPVGKAVHRAERFCQLSGASLDTPVTPELLADILLRENLGDQIFINQAENGGTMVQARRLAERMPCPVSAGSLQGGIWLCLS